MTASSVLVVVDMQPEFGTANNRPVVRRVCGLIRKYRAKNWPIIIVEYEGWGPTHPNVCGALAGYDNYHRVEKDEDGGGYLVGELLDELCIPIKTRIEVCGVNRCACVRATALELQDLQYRVRVIDSACNCQHFYYALSCDNKPLRKNGVLVK